MLECLSIACMEEMNVFKINDEDVEITQICSLTVIFVKRPGLHLVNGVHLVSLLRVFAFAAIMMSFEECIIQPNILQFIAFRIV